MRKSTGSNVMVTVKTDRLADDKAGLRAQVRSLYIIQIDHLLSQICVGAVSDM